MLSSDYTLMLHLILG